MDNELFQCPLETPFEDPENRLNDLIKEQANLRRKLTFIYTAAGAGKNFDLREAEDIISRLFDVQQQLFPDGPSEAELEKAAVYTDRFRIIKECRSEHKKCNVSSSPPARQQNSIQLAPRQVPEFSGKFNDWIRFKGIFNRLVHNNQSLEEEDKEGYLLLSCKDQALRLIEPFIGHPNAYTTMWEALTKHYESSIKVKDNILDEIRMLPFLRYDLDENVKEFMEKASIIVSHVKQFFGNEPEFQRRVCSEFFHRMHQEYLNRNMDTMERMDDIIKTLEGSHNRRDRYINHGLAVPGPPDGQRANTPSKGSQRKANNQRSENDACCAFCSESHFTNLCTSTAQTPVERKKIAEDCRLCFNCLRSDHSEVENCTSKYSCKLCKRKHHTLLHDPNRASVNAPDQQQLSQAAQQPGQTAIKQLNIQAEEWPTAGILMFLDENPDSSDPIVMAIFNNRKVRVYLDSCGGRTMIKRSLINASMIRQSNFIEFRGQFGGRQISADVVLFKAMLKDDKLVEFTAYVSNDADNDADIILGNDQFFKVMKQSSLTVDGYCFFETEIPGREVVKYGGRKKGHQVSMNRIRAIPQEPSDVLVISKVYDRLPSNELIETDKASVFESITRNDGRFEVALKTKDSAPIPANNFRLAINTQELEAVVATINASSPGSVSKPAETFKTAKRKSTKNASPTELEGFDHRGTWETLVKAVKDRLQSQSNREVQAAEANRFIHQALQQQRAIELTELEAIKRPHFIGDEGIIRMRIRLPSESGPVLISSNSRIAHLIVKDKHRKSKHKGKLFTKALCNESYFTRKLDSKVHWHISRCFKCQQRRKEAIRQPTALAAQGLVKSRKPKAIEVGKVINLREPNVQRSDWNLARIRKVFPGPYDITRRVGDQAASPEYVVE